MIKQLLSAAVILVLAGNVTAEDNAENIVSNPGFEEWVEYKGKIKENKTPQLIDNKVPEDWNVSMHSPRKATKVTGAVAKDSTVKRSGETSVRIDNANITDSTEVVRWNIFIKPETKYKVSVWVKGKGIVLDKKNRCGAAIWASSGPEKGFWGNKQGGHKFLKKGGDFDWTQLSFELDTRDIDEQLIVTIQLRLSKGTLWIDDVEIIEQNK